MRDNTVISARELPVFGDYAFSPVVSGTPGERTLANFLRTAAEPVGTTLYIYGGAWDWQDVGSSIQARTIGVSPDWVRFFQEQDENFTYKSKDGDESNADPKTSYYPYGEYNEYYYAGLDCSGYLGWAIYNTLETESGKDGYVFFASSVSKMLSEMGLGEWTQDIKAPTSNPGYEMKPGDIMSTNGHVWISLGTCDDGSVVILHSTPADSRTGQPGGGVELSAIGESYDCEAYLLADYYMSEYYPEWYERYPVKLADPETYFTFEGENAGRFTWNTSGDGECFDDPEAIGDMTPAEVLSCLYSSSGTLTVSTADDGLFASVQETVDSPEWVTQCDAAQDESVTQLFIVAGLGMDKTTATVSMHERDENGVWKQVLSTPAFVGKYGLCLDKDHKEGCGQTPIGVYSFNKAFGIATDPGCAIPYIQVDDDTYWSGDERDGMHYNEMVSLAEYPDLDMENSEHIVDCSYEYQYCLNISFNEDGTPGRGSAIFLHCFGAVKPYTGGCVALPEYIMKQVMQRVQPDCVVVIDTLKTLTGSEYVGGDVSFIDDLVLVNKENPLPEDWEETVEIVHTINSLGDDVAVERDAYEAYLKLREALAEEGVYVDLDSAYRSVAEQEDIVERFTAKYGEDYVRQYVAVPGYSEHHTGLALDLYLVIDGEDVYLNEDMVEYPEVWAQIHEKLADYGFILRYLEGKEAITGYSYEPWHIRYVGVDAAREIAEQGITLEEYLGQTPAHDMSPTVD